MAATAGGQKDCELLGLVQEMFDIIRFTASGIVIIVKETRRDALQRGTQSTTRTSLGQDHR
jgi:hypothetical protein